LPKQATYTEPNIRWAPSQEDLQEKACEQLIPPLIYKVRLAVKKWRDTDYSGASDTTKALLHFWFKPVGHLSAPGLRQERNSSRRIFRE